MTPSVLRIVFGLCISPGGGRRSPAVGGGGGARERGKSPLASSKGKEPDWQTLRSSANNTATKPKEKVSLPACLPARLPACLPARLPACLLYSLSVQQRHCMHSTLTTHVYCTVFFLFPALRHRPWLSGTNALHHRRLMTAKANGPRWKVLEAHGPLAAHVRERAGVRALALTVAAVGGPAQPPQMTSASTVWTSWAARVAGRITHRQAALQRTRTETPGRTRLARLDWTGLDWTGLDWTGLDWTRFCGIMVFVASLWDKNEKKTASFEKLTTHTSISNLRPRVDRRLCGLLRQPYVTATHFSDSRTMPQSHRR